MSVWYYTCGSCNIAISDHDGDHVTCILCDSEYCATCGAYNISKYGESEYAGYSKSCGSCSYYNPSDNELLKFVHSMYGLSRDYLVTKHKEYMQHANT